jgi:tRNA(His) 5'-end guanylyltransferase
MIAISFVPEPQIFAWLKKPYDEEFHTILRASAEQCLKRADDATALISDQRVFIFAKELTMSTLSYFTAFANYYWNDRKHLLVFWAEGANFHSPLVEEDMKNICEEDMKNICEQQIEKEKKKIQEQSRLTYEMYLAEHRTDFTNTLFPEYGILPYEKTPEYFRKGIIITNERTIS